MTHFDTAEIYTCKAEDGSTIYNETVVGKGIAAINKRDELQIATKYFPAFHGDTMTPEMVVEACRASCQRLGVNKCFFFLSFFLLYMIYSSGSEMIDHHLYNKNIYHERNNNNDNN